MALIQVLNGPNLNLLGLREPQHYGNVTLESIKLNLEQLVSKSGHRLQFLQSNAEYVLIDALHNSLQQKVAFIIINPAAFTHTSVALRDALLGVKIPFIEVHLSNIYAREPFRTHSYFSDIAVGIISGLGAYGYELALQAALQYINHQQPNE